MLGPNALIASAAASPSLSLDVSGARLHEMGDYELVSRMGDYKFSTQEGWQTWESMSIVTETLTSKEIGSVLVMSHQAGWGSVEAFEGKGWFGVLTGEHGYWNFRVAAKTSKLASKVMQAVSSLVGEVSLDADEVSMAVWSEHPMGGGVARWSTMKVGTWGDVSQNYPAATRASLEHLASALPDKSDGGLVVFCGPAGTGKTRAIEALAAAWARDARLGVVVDSDRMLQSASYLADVLTSAGDTRQVVVAEDVDELVVNGPKSHETSKLLNIADGLVGRLAGAGTLFILTANLPREEIAEYVVRPGRAAAVVEFELFSEAEARAWLDARDCKAEASDGMSLANLYGALRG